MTDITPADLAKFTPCPWARRSPQAWSWTAEPLAALKPPLTERVREFAEEVLAAPPVGLDSVILDVENQQNRWIAEAASILAEIAERLDADR